ncbi:DivIVA domain-containing protein [Kineococcus sp. SYSU DK018]|uniref:DivIVA domain-containing protein n=1 Tax=Kineococcus sp. SYSU DK018 TaxID=3383139 RepID=UPI003D7E31E9
MTVALLVLVLLTVGAVAAVAVGRVGGALGPATSTRPFRGLPEGPVQAADVDEVRFSSALRGYRMDEVDAVLDRLREEIRERDEELDAWRSAED